MTRQVRAERTRLLLIEAAGSEFVRHGYAGTSLARISKAARATIGALTFHFPTKAELADAVCQVGTDLTRRSVDYAAGTPTAPLDRVTATLHVLTDLLEWETAVRAAARLSREHPGVRAPWTDAWLPGVRALLEEARDDGSLHRDTPPETITHLVRCLVTGAEASMLLDQPAGEAAWEREERLHSERITAMWRVVLPAFTRSAAPPGPPPTSWGPDLPEPRAPGP